MVLYCEYSTCTSDFNLYIIFPHRLTYLYLGGNRLRQVPPELGNLTKLTALILCGNQLQFLPRQLHRLTNLESLRLHDNQLQTLTPGIVRLKNLKELSLRNNPLVLRFIREWNDSVPTLLELSGRSVKRYGIPYNPQTVPETLCDFLNNSQKCDNPSCQGVYFTSRVRRVKFVDFCGKYRVPLMQYLCSSLCDIGEDGSHSSSYSSSSDDEADEARIKKVLLG